MASEAALLNNPDPSARAAVKANPIHQKPGTKKSLTTPTKVDSQAAPALWVLGLLARVGIKSAIKQIGKTKIKKSTKSYLLNNKGVKWNKILAPKHKWKKVGAKSKQQVAEIMGKAMANGKHSSYRGSKHAKQAVYKYKYKGKKYTVVVTYAKKGGKISNGWVK